MVALWRWGRSLAVGVQRREGQNSGFILSIVRATQAYETYLGGGGRGGHD